MKKVFAPAALADSSSVDHPASSSSGSAAQPVPTTSNSESAAQPLWNIERLRDVERWLSAEHVISSSIDTRHIREAVAILSAKPKPTWDDVRRVQNKWKIPQQIAQKARPLEDVITELQDKVVEAAQKLEQQLASCPEQPSRSAGSFFFTKVDGKQAFQLGCLYFFLLNFSLFRSRSCGHNAHANGIALDACMTANYSVMHVAQQQP